MARSGNTPSGWTKKSPISRCQRIDFALRHAGTRAFEVLSLEIANEEAIRPQKQRVVLPSRLAQGGLHLGPHLSVPLFVLFEPIRFNLQHKTNTLHMCSLAQAGLG